MTLGQAFARYAGHSNTHVFMLPAYTGLLLSMEEQIAGGVLPASVLTSLRTTLATTLSALGDAFFSGSMRTFWALTCVCLLLEGNIWPAAIFTLILLSILQIFRVISFFFCLTHGIAALRWIRSVDVPTWVERTKICNALLICLTLWIMLDAGLSGWSLPTQAATVAFVPLAALVVGRLHVPRLIIWTLALGLLFLISQGGLNG